MVNCLVTRNTNEKYESPIYIGSESMDKVIVVVYADADAGYDNRSPEIRPGELKRK